MTDRNEQTICAISTPHGRGGISVIRVSGRDALKICQKFSQKLRRTEVSSHRLYFSDFSDFENNKVDEVVFSYFAEGKSFTGEEVVEISCHGSPFITQQIIDLLVAGGCRTADRGEFTYRAFMNGRLDLVQAESVLSLIESQNKAASKLALRQLEGFVSKEFEEIISDLIWCLAHIEASIDFIEQGVEVVDKNELVKKLKTIRSRLEKLIRSYKSGRLVQDGYRVALIGEPNVGKSSLLNLLVQSEKAIVTPVAGTTRDVIESDVVFAGLKFKIVDTAGLRSSEDQIEMIGIQRSRQEAVRADLVCYVADIQNFEPQTIEEKLKELRLETPVCLLLNKADRMAHVEIKNHLQNRLNSTETRLAHLAVSAHNPESREVIFNFFKQQMGELSYLDEAVISSSRQLEQARYAFEMISKSLGEIENNLGAEFVAMYLKDGLVSLQKILGQVYDDQIMDRVFKEFCLGK